MRERTNEWIDRLVNDYLYKGIKPRSNIIEMLNVKRREWIKTWKSGYVKEIWC